MPFDFSNTIRQFFGLNQRENHNREHPKEYWDPRWNDSNQNDHNDHDNYRRGDDFDLFNQFDMHRHIEQQFNEIFRMFSGSLFDQPFPRNEFNFFENDNQPQYIEPEERSIRDEYLKPGFETELENRNNVKDTDLDGVIAPQDLDSFMRNGREPVTGSSSLMPTNPNVRFFGQTVITSTVIKPDGTRETRRTVRDNRTNEEETTITITQPDNPNIPRLDDSPHDNIWDKFFRR